jgi:drug/metabolite transporter superfamily protein YnfA
MKQGIVKLVNFVVNALYVIIGAFIVSIFVVDAKDVTWFERVVVLIVGVIVMFMLKLLSGYIEKKLKEE